MGLCLLNFKFCSRNSDNCLVDYLIVLKMSQDYSKLKEDWANDPTLKYLACDTVEELAAHLLRCHKTLTGPKGGPYGYLYQQQIKRNRELKNELSKYKTSWW